MDTLIEKERDLMREIAESGKDHPVFMINQNRYKEGEFLTGVLHR